MTAVTACYRNETLDLKKPGAFEAVVNAAYILTTEGSTRIAECISRTRMHPPHSMVHVRYNKTFKNCQKPNVHNSRDDLLDAHRKCLDDALDRGYTRFLVMEDDCEYIVQRMHLLLPLVETMPADADALLLGCVPIRSRRVGSLLRVYRAGGTHAVVWTAAGARRFLALDERGHVDLLMSTRLVVYAPLVPIAVQRHPDTENSKTWLVGIDYLMHRWVFRSHKDGRVLYEWGHRIGRIGGTFQLIEAIVIAVFLFLFGMALRLHVTPSVSRRARCPQHPHTWPATRHDVSLSYHGPEGSSSP